MNISVFNNNQIRALQPLKSGEHGAYRYDVQGLRAVAVLAVILFHVDKSWLPAGFLGVDMFFVISGFVITPIILRRGLGGFWLKFYWGRVRRIVPAFLVMLLLVSVLAAVFFIASDFKIYRDGLRSSFWFYSNYYFSDFGSYFAPAVHELPLLHTWSLAVEMQFYLLLPCLLVWVPRRWLMPVLILVVIGLTLHAELRLGEPGEAAHVYFSLLSRIPEFLIGACLALSSVGERWTRQRANALAGLACLVLFCCLFLLEPGHFPGFTALVPCVATAMLIAANRSVFADWLSKPAMIWIGAISYSLYLWHWPTLAFIRYWSGSYQLTLLQLVLFALTTLFFACLSYYLVEVPMRRSGSWRRVTGLLAVSLVVLFGVVPSLNNRIERPLPPSLTRYAPAEEICHGQMVGACKRGDPAESARTLVLGDSHGAQLNYFFDAAGKQQKFAVKVVTASNCVPIPGFDVERIPDYSRRDCEAQIQAVTALLGQVDTVVVAGMWQWQGQSEAFLTALYHFLRAMSAQGKHVIVLAQVPMFEVNVQRMRRFEALGMHVTPEQEGSWKSANEAISRLVSRIEDVDFLDFSSSEFFKDAPYEHGVLIYLDNHHLNEVGAVRYGEMAAPALVKLIGPSK